VIKKREKHFIGNLYMAGISIPLGYGLAGLGGIAPAGALAGLAASIVERFEFGVIDDNILVAVSSSVLLYVYDVLYHFAIG
jgi:phytol kinase